MTKAADMADKQRGRRAKTNIHDLLQRKNIEQGENTWPVDAGLSFWTPDNWAKAGSPRSGTGLLAKIGPPRSPLTTSRQSYDCAVSSRLMRPSNTSWPFASPASTRLRKGSLYESSLGKPECPLPRATSASTKAVAEAQQLDPLPAVPRRLLRVPCSARQAWIARGDRRFGPFNPNRNRRLGGRILQDHVRGFFRNHHDRRIGVAGDHRGHDGPVDHAQPFYAAHAQLLVDHGGGVPAHAASARRMKDGRTRLAGERQELRIARAAGIGRALFGDITAYCRLLHDPPEKLHPGDDGVAVGSARQIARLDRWRLRRIGGFDTHEAAALRPQLTHRCDEARERVQRGTRRVGAENDEMDLHVGCRNKRGRAEKPTGIAGADGEQPLPEQKISQPGGGSMPPTVDHIVHRDPIRAAILHTDLKMILQVGPDPRHIRHHVDAVRP